MTEQLLMCLPKFYDIKYVINTWMIDNLYQANKNLAWDQWAKLYLTLVDIIGADNIRCITGHENLPDMTFAANAGLVLGKTVILSNFWHLERRPEKEIFKRWFKNEGYAILELPDHVFFEGEGDALFDDDKRLWVGYGFRSDKKAADIIRGLGIETHSVSLIDPRFYHLDTCFAPLSKGHLLYYPEAFDKISQYEIEDQFSYHPSQLIPVSEEDALNFACNAINLGDYIIVNRISDALREKLEYHGYNVKVTPVGEFLKAGGGTACLKLKL